jgi:CBS domain containing-hemolysin-like protein
MVIVVDEFGTVKGLANLHDLIGGLVGQITEDEERSEFEFRRLDPQTWIFSPLIRIERVNELTGLAIPEGDYKTLAGFLLFQMRRIPLPHERLRWRDADFEILAADSRRIRSVRLVRRPPLMVRRVRRLASLPGDGRPGDEARTD